MARVPNGTGRTSSHYIPTHPFHGGQKWWRSEEDYKAFKDEQNAKRRANTVAMRLVEPRKKPIPHNPGGRKGQAPTSNVQTEVHTFYRWGRWWRSEEEYQEFRKRWLAKKRANKNEVSVDRQVQLEREAKLALDISTKRKSQLHNEFDRLRAKHGLAPNANRAALKNVYIRTLDPEIKQFFHLESIAVMKADEKLQAIRDLFLSGAKPQDILYRTALMVGVMVKEKEKQ